MSETNPLNYKLLNFAIYLGLALHQFKKKLLLIKLIKFAFEDYFKKEKMNWMKLLLFHRDESTNKVHLRI